MTTSERLSGVLAHWRAIVFTVLCVCLAGGYAGFTMPSSVFPETQFPRVVILIDNGVMPADAMMATVTRPVEEAMESIPGATNVRSATGRGSAEVNVFFDEATDMVQAELYVLGRIAEIRSRLPATAQLATHRLTFAAFPILGISLTSAAGDLTELWEKARYELEPRLLRVAGVARVNIVGGREPEYHVIVDPVRLGERGLSAAAISRAIAAANLFTSAGLHEENHQLYLTVVDNRLRSARDLERVVVGHSDGAPIELAEVARVVRGAAPHFNIVTADGAGAVLMNVYAQPDSDTVGIVDDLARQVAAIRRELPPKFRLAFFYDQSQFVREGIASVWESIALGLMLSVLVLFAFLRSLRATVVAAVVIPVTVLFTLAGLRLMGMGFNLMTLGGIAAAIGLVIDDAIVVVEAIHVRVQQGLAPARAVVRAVREVGPPLVGSTLTPTVVFLPLSLLDGVPGAFFRALAITMVVALLSSLLLAVTWTPAVGAVVLRPSVGSRRSPSEGAVMSRVVRLYEWCVRRALRWSWLSLIVVLALAAGGIALHRTLDSEFLPPQDEGAFVIDYFSRPGTSLSETDRMLQHVESILRATPEVESYSRRTGARLALAIAEPNTGDFLVRLRPDRGCSTSAVVDALRARITAAEPALTTEFPGVLSDLIGDLTWSPDPVEIKVYSNDVSVLRQAATAIAAAIEEVPGVVDVNDGLVVAGPTLRFRVDEATARSSGLTPAMVGDALRADLVGDVSSSVLRGDRLYQVRVLDDPLSKSRESDIRSWPVRGPTGSAPLLHEIASTEHESGILEMHREDLRQLVAVSARFSGIDMGRGIAAIEARLAKTLHLPAGTRIEFGGLYQQQQESFRNLAIVLVMAVLLVFGVLIFEFRSLLAPVAIILGALLALIGVVAALAVTGTSLNIVSFLGAIIGMGIVAKNGILMLDFVEHQRKRGFGDHDALVLSGRRRLRPVLMTSLTTFLGLLPLAYGVGAGADMLRPLAIAILGALAISIGLSLVATPVFYDLGLRLTGRARKESSS